MPDRKFPNLFVIGAMKSGTTTLHTALGSHPEILMSSYKEPQYFTGTYYRHRLEFDDRPPDPDGRWYFDMFKPAHDDPGIKYAGESSADYTQRPVFEGCAGRIAAFNPAARILYIVRDPVERCVAHYWHNVHIEYETRPPSEALWEDPRFIAFSDYAMQLQPYLEVFPREQIHVLTLESFRDDQAGALRDLRMAGRGRGLPGPRADPIEPLPRGHLPGASRDALARPGHGHAALAEGNAAAAPHFPQQGAQAKLEEDRTRRVRLRGAHRSPAPDPGREGPEAGPHTRAGSPGMDDHIRPGPAVPSKRRPATAGDDATDPPGAGPSDRARVPRNPTPTHRLPRCSALPPSPALWDGSPRSSCCSRSCRTGRRRRSP